MKGHTLSGQAFIDKLERDIPTWILGLDEETAQLNLIRKTMAPANQEFRGLGQSLAAWSWQFKPLKPGVFKTLAGTNGLREALPPACRTVFDRLEGTLVSSDPLDGIEQLMAENRAQTLKIILPALGNPDSGLPLLGSVWDSLLRLGREDIPMAALEAYPWPENLDTVRDRLRAEWAFHYKPPERALALVLELDPDTWDLWREYAAAELELRLGNRKSALSRLSGLWRKFPHHPGLTLKLHDLIHSFPETDIGTDDVCILLYSWNKAELLEDTLKSLSGTDYGQARVLVLDNGSDDGTSGMLEKIAGEFPTGVLETVSLPVNIGAPGARNWLLSRPEVRERKWAAFLDDDVLLPVDWLARLLSAASSASGIGTVGCRIVSADTPPALQSADYNLLPPRSGIKTFQDFEENIMVFDNCAGSLDTGLFTYRRPALSVSGCCHLLNMASVRDAGGFDIRFSPTQFDDLERDMRTALAGYSTIYAGDLAVRHVQHSSLAKATSAKAMAQVFGNKIKLEGKFERKQIQTLAQGGLDRLWEDYKVKWNRLTRDLRPEAA